MTIGKCIPFHVILIASIFNGFFAMIIGFFIITPLAVLISYLIAWDLNKVVGYVYKNIDVLIISFVVGYSFEVTDRVIRGRKKSKIISIVRDKEDRW